MKKITLLLFIFFLLKIKLSAQHNKIEITLNSLFFFKQNFATNDSTNFGAQKSLQILPSIGYYRELKNNYWLGIDFAYQKSSYHVSQTINYPLLTYTRKTTNSLPYKSYFVCPKIFEVFEFKNLQLTPSFIFPIQYITKKDQYLNFYNTDKATNVLYLEEYKTLKSPKILNLGIYFNMGVAHRIYRKIFLGTQVGLGVLNVFYFGNGSKNIKQIQNGIQVKDENYTFKYKKYQTSKLDLRPTLSVYYSW